MTLLMDDGTIPHPTTPVQGFPLPHADEGRYVPEISGGMYKLPHPETGKVTRFSRATTVAETLDDRHGLHRWQTRLTITGLAQNEVLARRAARAVEDGDNRTLDELAASSADQAGAAYGREFGTAVHAWAEEVDHGRCLPVQVPGLFREHVVEYLRTLARHAVTPLPEFRERIVFNPHANAVGTLDGLYRLADGSTALGDMKTSKSLQYGYLTHGVQLAIYAGATHMLALDGSGWEPMPPIRRDFAVLIHCPSDGAHRTALLPYALAPSQVALDMALRVRAMRSQAKKFIPNQHALPYPDAATADYYRAVAAIQTSTSTADLAAVREEYAGVWTPTLDSLATTVAEVIAQVKAEAHVYR